MLVYEKVRSYIEDHGMKRMTVAKKAGIPNATLDAILSGKRKMYAEDLRAICLALNVRPELFIEVQSTSK